MSMEKEPDTKTEPSPPAPPHKIDFDSVMNAVIGLIEKAQYQSQKHHDEPNILDLERTYLDLMVQKEDLEKKRSDAVAWHKHLESMFELENRRIKKELEAKLLYHQEMAEKTLTGYNRIAFAVLDGFKLIADAIREKSK